MVKTGVFIKARVKSTRLPKKALLKIKGKSAIEHLIERAKLAVLPDIIVLCTSIHKDDVALVEIAKKNGIEYFQGSEDDVLQRYLDAAKKFNIGFFVNIDGDDILFAYEFIDKIIEVYRKTNADYITCVGLPIGAAPTGVKVKAVEEVCKIKDETDTEVWGEYFTGSGLFRVEYIEAEGELRCPEVRMTLDYKEDLEFFKEIFDRLYEPGKLFGLKEILNLLKNNPEIIEINRGMQEEYLKNLKRHTKVKVRKVKR
jgi:spore coat polysaccharide biosynthesis protein SpsF (cytidylyltransferase family)